ncbi:ABC transporter ATP-binding protein [Halobaculum gomorrense]|uniref:Branched-chain amino acid transport system ATP-binding protein n=1 Tax=Halobaculum gomorrense TaxID=43928 RepID=A0A1M5V1F4_9EURY|nr:ABC transporter ATP-binding protein [Halobaculum gomorrense]SHH69049.1 branched-chain amino acid transport system ATP-binding protein [Halobaculum gomorrense]
MSSEASEAERSEASKRAGSEATREHGGGGRSEASKRARSERDRRSVAADGGTASSGATRAADAARPDDSLLRVRDLDAGYGDLQILTDVHMDVGDGEYVTIVGPNGAGKSTVMKSVFGLTSYMGGTIEFAGEAIHGLAPEEIIHEGIGYVPQNDNVFESLTVRENLEMGAYILDEVPEEQIEVIYDRFPILRERSDQRAGTMSGGQRQMLAMGRALMLDPDLLLLDEPSAGLAPDLVQEMFDRIDRINDDGTAVLMVEQNAKEALGRCDRGYVLVNGENAYVDSGEALLNDEQVRKDFLGG